MRDAAGTVLSCVAMSYSTLRALFDDKLRVEVSAGVTEKDEVELLAALSPDETPAGFQSWAEKRRREYRCGRHHARHALSLAGAPPAPILRDDEGIPLFPPGFQGSITHTGKESTFAVAAVLPGAQRIGIDAEILRELPEDMVAHILSDRERKILGDDLSGEVSPILAREGLRSLLGFSAKEAYYKCIFPRLRCRLSFHDVEFRVQRRPNGEAPGRFEIRLLRSDIPGAPAALAGSYKEDSRFVVCGVSW